MARTSVCVVGPGTRFLSGITYYTLNLCNALTARADVSAILVRRLLPKRLYPGRARVGTAVTTLELDPRVHSFDGVDWFWLPSLLQAIAFLRRRRPSHLVLEWWTGTTLHTYLVLAIVARRLGARVVIEFHETQDVGEAGAHPLARRYVDACAPLLFRRAARYVAHSMHERASISAQYGIPESAIAVIPHAAGGHLRRGARTHSPDGTCNLLFFGVIRPFKGLEDLVRAFDLLEQEDPTAYRLSVVGETWESWTLPAELIDASPFRDRISFVNRYVSDAEVEAAFAAADVVVLPYRRSAQSGPLHVAMDFGLPVVTTAVGGLVESAGGYAGAVLVEPADPEAIAAGIRRARSLVGHPFSAPSDWSATGRLYDELFTDGAE